MKTTSHCLLMVAFVAGLLLSSHRALAQTPTGTGRIILEVPSDARVFFNDHATKSTGSHRRFFRDGLQRGESFRYDVRVVGQFQGRPWSREETVYLKADETKRLAFRYTDPPRTRVRRPTVPTPSINAPVRLNIPVPPDSSSWLLPLPPIRDVDDAAAFLVVPLKDLQVSAGTLTQGTVEAVAHRRSPQDLPYSWATVDGGDEAYLDLAAADGPVLALRTSRSRTAVGKLSLPPIAPGQRLHLSYTAAVSDSSQQARRDFYKVKRSYYRQRLNKNAAGSAWFRHQLRDAVNHLTFAGAADPLLSSTPGQMAPTDLMKWYAIFAGGRAIAENLALEPYGSVSSGHDSVVRLNTIAGVTVPPINWKNLAPKVQPALDPLARLIPADQHAVFFPSAQQAIQLARHAADRETVFLGLADARAEHNRIQARYERQFAISLDELATILGSEQVQRVAVTGSDPHVVMGTDVAILFESPEPNVLAERLIKQIAENVRSSSDVKNHTSNSSAMTATGVRSGDRSINTYVAALPQAVVLTNSMVQLQRLTGLMTDNKPSLATLPEFAFFRDRYRLDDPGETALVVISDATIRRWCSPRWRIGQARRLHSAAVLAEWQATCMGRQTATLEPPPTELSGGLLDDVTVEHGQVYSGAYGSLSFMAPVAELPMDWVTTAERKAYEVWRAGYQRNWIRFDPIAIRLDLDGDHRLAVDMTVMPLRIRSDYTDIRSLTQGGKLAANAGDPHDSLAELAVAFNTKSVWFNMARMMATPYFHRNGQGGQIDPLAWFEGTVTLYADDDPAWKELIPRLRHNRGNPDLVAAIVTQLPIGIQAEVTSGLELTKFLIAMRAVVESTAPGMLKWEPREHRGKPYTKISTEEIVRDRRSPTSDKIAQEVEDAAIYYATFGDALIIAFRESVLQRALDRRALGHAPTGDVTLDHVWSGENVSLHVDAKLIELVADLVDEEYQVWMQSRAWSNLPILNEWKRRYPNEDPLAVHERLWNVRLICPGGGSYRWNETWQTMESTVYGHPAAPRKGPVLPPVLNQIATGDAGLTFEPNGLRARLTLQMKDTGVDGGH